ncbi:MAG: hypothetical protein ACR2OJ_18265 [Hyphomicrobiales bacterium]
MLAHLSVVSFETWLSGALVISVLLFIWALLVGTGVARNAEDDHW